MEQELRIETDWSLDPMDWQWFDGGFAIPSRFSVRAVSAGWTAGIAVEVTDGKARTRSVIVATDAPEGVTSNTVRRVPIREIVARGALNLLRRNRIAKDGTTKLAPFTLSEAEEAYAVLERVVGYLDVAPLDTEKRTA